ncbi:hypothetical protein [Aliidongia dinghuensis]|nr:hypothetical protein [Aliidongia dinghuensis]
MIEHAKDCRCLRCGIWREGTRRIEAGELDPWAFPATLTAIVAEIVGGHPDIEERARRAEWFCNQLLGLVEQHAPKERAQTIDDTTSHAVILPFRTNRRR